VSTHFWLGGRYGETNPDVSVQHKTNKKSPVSKETGLF